jgi:hypothetical protein
MSAPNDHRDHNKAENSKQLFSEIYGSSGAATVRLHNHLIQKGNKTNCTLKATPKQRPDWFTS